MIDKKLYKKAVKLAEVDRGLDVFFIQKKLKISHDEARRAIDQLIDDGLIDDTSDFNLTEDGDYRKSWNLYVLRLEDDKYYVGITTQTPEARMQNHIDRRNGAYWTAMHKPLSVVYSKDLGKISKRAAERQENRFVRKTMKLYGMNNVRGGGLTTTEEIVKIFGMYLAKEGWRDVKYIVLILLLLFSSWIYIGLLWFGPLEVPYAP